MPPRSRMAVAAGAALAAVSLISGCGPEEGADAGGEGGSGSTAAKAKLLHQVPMPKVSEMADAMGMWTTDRNFVKVGLKRISGYPLSGGTARWQIPLAGEVCWSSPEPTKDGLVAVLFENDKADYADCTEVGLVDLNTGKLRWHKRAMDDGDPISFDEVTIGGGTVAAGGTGGTAAWSTGGRALWKSDSMDGKCPADAYAGSGEKLIAVRDCGTVKNPKLRVETVNPRTRAAKSAFNLPAGTENVHVASADPLVLAVDDGKAKGGSGVSEFLTVDDSVRRGQLLSRIPMGGGKYGQYDADCPATEVTDCKQVVVSKEADALYLGTQDSAGDEANNDVVALSLKTGKRIARIPGASGGRFLPIGLGRDGEVLVYQQSGYTKGGAVWKISPSTRKKTKILQNPTSSRKTESALEIGDGRIHYAHGRLYIGNDDVTEPSGSRAEKDPLAAVFGTK
ncbi:hypothetical protein GCM10009801_04540 [Streptomyces albiaxialis]|uniref:PQQ-binding-like beta-propeller repeat protein n=1 Tax=Streptomyces albiaxialis TaxID=329523 RepID=A0ABN2VGX5_9ACTN